MVNFFHSYSPERLLISIGPIAIYWYGLFVICAILSGLVIVLRLGGEYGFKKEDLFDISFWLIIGGIAGARIYHILLETNYYFNNPIKIFAIWEGGVAIHGAIFLDMAILYFLSRKYKYGFWHISSIIVAGVSLGQTIGRWGNYFNQELFGKPTSLPWGIPIKPSNRPENYLDHSYFHPTFLYESLGNFLIFTFILYMHKKLIFINNQEHKKYKIIVAFYLIAYSVLRLSMEFIRIDNTPEFNGLRLPQVVSVGIIFVALVILIKQKIRFIK